MVGGTVGPSSDSRENRGSLELAKARLVEKVKAQRILGSERKPKFLGQIWGLTSEMMK